MATTAIIVHGDESDIDKENRDDEQDDQVTADVEPSPTPAPTVCPVCFQRFNPSRERHPMVMHCEHVVCLPCVKMLWLRDPVCPVCRETFAPRIVRALECIGEQCAMAAPPDMYQTRCCSNKICQPCSLAQFTVRLPLLAGRHGVHRAQLCFICPGVACPHPVTKSNVHRIQL
jgi:hypothetical protein